MKRFAAESLEGSTELLNTGDESAANFCKTDWMKEVTRRMEPNRYWLLYFGLLFVFLGSNVGKAFCLWVSSILRACFYAVLALAAAALAKLLLTLSSLLLNIANAHMDEQERLASPHDGNDAANAHKGNAE